MKTVLLVEDDPMVAMAYGARLKSMGYRVHTAGDEASAITQVREVKPDLVLLDISLPGGDGFVVAERIKPGAGQTGAAIIFMTASQRPDLRTRAKQYGAAGFLQKPFDAASLADAIESALSCGGQARAKPALHDAH